MSFQELFCPGRPVLEFSTFPRILAGPKISSLETPRNSEPIKTPASPTFLTPDGQMDSNHRETFYKVDATWPDLHPVLNPPRQQLAKIQNPSTSPCYNLSDFQNPSTSPHCNLSDFQNPSTSPHCNLSDFQNSSTSPHCNLSDFQNPSTSPHCNLSDFQNSSTSPHCNLSAQFYPRLRRFSFAGAATRKTTPPSPQLNQLQPQRPQLAATCG